MSTLSPARLSQLLTRFRRIVPIFLAILILVCAPQSSRAQKVINARGETLVLETQKLKGGTLRRIIPAHPWAPWSAETAAFVNVMFEQQRQETFREHKPPALPPQVVAENYVDGLFLVHSPQGYGLYNEAGKEILPPKYEQVSELGEQMFLARKTEPGERQSVLIDINGRISSLPAWPTSDYKFHEGYLNISNWNERKYSLVNRNGELLFPPDKYSRIEEFYNGLAAIQYEKGNTEYGAYIDHTGRTVLGPFERATVGGMYNGFGCVAFHSGDGKDTVCGALDVSGKWLLEPVYDMFQRLPNNEWLVRKQHKWQIVTSAGEVKVAFPDNCSYVPTDTWGCSPPDIHPCAFGGTEVANFEVKNALWGYCDSSGNIVIKPQFQRCFAFVNDLAMVSVGADPEALLTGVINRKGEYVLQPKYKTVEIRNSDQFVVTDETSIPGIPDGERAPFIQYEDFTKFRLNSKLIGMSFDEIGAAFGNRPTIYAVDAHKKRIYRSGTRELIHRYDLTPCPTCGYDFCVLELAFSEQQKVTAWRIFCPKEANNPAWNLH